MDNAETVGRLLDVSVARVKFDQEVSHYRASEAAYHASGCWLLSASFPYAYFVFAHPLVKPTPVVSAVRFDFSNYDLLPISVKFVDPFTRTLVPSKAIAYPMFQRSNPSGEQLNLSGEIALNPLVLGHSPEDTPFLCVAGVLEYHLHPGHSGDHWWLHRTKGEGTLAHLLNIFVQYGIMPLNGYNVQASVRGMTLDVNKVP